MSTKNKRFNIGQELEKLYIEIPSALIYEPKYKPNKEIGKKGLSNDAKVLYGILLERTRLSVWNATEKNDTSFIDENGDIFIYFDDKSIAEILNLSEKKGRDVKKELVNYNLLEEVRQGLGKANRLYLNIVETNKENIKLYRSELKKVVAYKKKSERLRIKKYRKEKAETVENTLNGKFNRTCTVENSVLVQSDLLSSNKELSKTDFSKTEFKKSVVVINGIEKKKTKAYEIQVDKTKTIQEKIQLLNDIQYMTEHTKALMYKFIEFNILVSEAQIKMLNECVYDIAIKSIDLTIAKAGMTFSYFYEIYLSKEQEDIALVANWGW